MLLTLPPELLENVFLRRDVVVDDNGGEWMGWDPETCEDESPKGSLRWNQVRVATANGHFEMAEFIKSRLNPDKITRSKIKKPPCPPLPGKPTKMGRERRVKFKF